MIQLKRLLLELDITPNDQADTPDPPGKKWTTLTVAQKTEFAAYYRKMWHLAATDPQVQAAYSEKRINWMNASVKDGGLNVALSDPPPSDPPPPPDEGWTWEGFKNIFSFDTIENNPWKSLAFAFWMWRYSKKYSAATEETVAGKAATAFTKSLPFTSLLYAGGSGTLNALSKAMGITTTQMQKRGAMFEFIQLAKNPKSFEEFMGKMQNKTLTSADKKMINRLRKGILDLSLMDVTTAIATELKTAAIPKKFPAIHPETATMMIGEQGMKTIITVNRQEMTLYKLLQLNYLKKITAATSKPKPKTKPKPKNPGKVGY